MNGLTNYIEREVKRRAFVVARWNFREQEKQESAAEAKRKAGVSDIFHHSCSLPLDIRAVVVGGGGGGGGGSGDGDGGGDERTAHNIAK